VVFIQNQLTKFPIPLPIPKLNPLQPPLGAISPGITNLTILRDTAKLSPMQAISRGLAAASNSQDAVSGTGALDITRYGRLLKARKLVGVRGSGPAFDGLYFVKSVTTTIKHNEIKQNFNLVPSLIIQIEDYVNERANEAMLELSMKPVDQLDESDHGYLLRYFFYSQLFPKHKKVL